MCAGIRTSVLLLQLVVLGALAETPAFGNANETSSMYCLLTRYLEAHSFTIEVLSSRQRCLQHSLCHTQLHTLNCNDSEKAVAALPQEEFMDKCLTPEFCKLRHFTL